MPTVDGPLIFSLIWIIGCAAASFILLRWRPSDRLPPIALILITAFLVRLIPALILPRGAAYEMSLFQQTADAFREGDNIYLSSLTHPYLPLLVYWFSIADWLAEAIGLFFIFWLKSISIIADTLLSGLVYLAVLHLKNDSEARYAAWIYAFNPLTILVVSYQGQFDLVTTLFLMLSWYLFALNKQSAKKLSLSAILLGMAILVKTWPFIFLPIVLLRLPNWKSRIRYTLLVGIIPLASLLIYETFFPGSIASILGRASRAGAISGWWGYSSIINVWLQLSGQGSSLFGWVSQYGKYLGYLLGFIVIFITRKRPSLYSLLLTILVMFAAVPNLGLQGLSWIVSMALILGLYNSLGWYMLGSTIHMLVSYWGIHLTRWLDFILEMETANRIIQLSSLTAWLVIVVWCLQELMHKPLLPKVFSPDLDPESRKSLTVEQ